MTKRGEIQTFPSFSEHYASLGYILVHLNGETGWHRCMMQDNSKRLTLPQYICVQLMIRPKNVNCSGILRAYGLLPQYLVDMVLVSQRFILDWYRKAQEKVKIRNADVKDVK